MAKPINIGDQPPTEDLDSTSSSENSTMDNHNNTNNSSYYEPMEPPTTSELTFMPRSSPVVHRLVAGNATFYGQALRQESNKTFAPKNDDFNDSSNKTFNGNASTWSTYNSTARTGATTTNADGQAETTFGGPYTDLIPNDLNSTFFGHTLLGSQQNNETPTPATRSAASLVCICQMFVYN